MDGVCGILCFRESEEGGMARNPRTGGTLADYFAGKGEHAEIDEVMARIASGREATFPLDVMKKMRSQNRIAVLRDYWGMTQRQLAELAGTDPMTISQIETGRARGGLDVMRNIAAALKVSLDVLIPPRRSTAARTEAGKRKLNMRGRSGRGKRG
jgi:DNA-binding XRE family transcriptional regulator